MINIKHAEKSVQSWISLTLGLVLVDGNANGIKTNAIKQKNMLRQSCSG